MRRLALLLTVALPLVGCTEAVTDPISWVEGVEPRDAGQLTVVIADILANSLNAPETTLSVQPATGPASAGFDTLLADTLRERGFALAPEGMPYPGSHTVLYAISPMYSSVMLRLDVDQARATCLFTRSPAGGIQATTPCSVENSAALTLKPVVHIVSPPQPVSSFAKPPPVPTPVTRGPIALAPATAPVRAITLAPVALAARPTAPMAVAAPASVGHPPIVAVPLPPPAPPAPPRETWTLSEGEPVRTQIEQWGVRAHWDVKWQSPRNWMVPVTTPFSGSFKDAVSAVVRAAATQGVDIRARFYDPNSTLVITSPGAPGGSHP